MNNSAIYYSVGPLLYCPADRASIASSISAERFGTNYSLALCLEDTINDNFVAKAEEQLVSSVNDIYRSLQESEFYLPKIFIRVRRPGQIKDLSHRLGDSHEIITGYIVPKFSLSCADGYIEQIADLNSGLKPSKYVMPIYESSSIVNLRTRCDSLYGLKEKLAPIESSVLNIRVGGNDLCHLFGFRREPSESIHQIAPIANILADIVTVYGTDYVISGPVWEYYAGDGWEEGIKREIADDRLCGFIGKTVIHPNQIKLVNDGYKVSEKNYRDALHILHWNTREDSYVSGSISGDRMDEYKTHINWAQKTRFMAECFGVTTHKS
ncbi:MAG: HpcH/HpaI aldolase/citrate lyase family protein [Dorea sp.]|nr:HpcH/HpaI aldolase/citrate lyase family protein [Dorea sp.]